jgi:hypothetical protein
VSEGIDQAHAWLHVVHREVAIVHRAMPVVAESKYTIRYGPTQETKGTWSDRLS